MRTKNKQTYSRANNTISFIIPEAVKHELDRILKALSKTAKHYYSLAVYKQALPDVKDPEVKEYMEAFIEKHSKKLEEVKE